MTYRKPVRTTTRRLPGLLVAVLLVVSAAIGYRLLESSSWTAPSPIDVLYGDPAPATGDFGQPATGDFGQPATETPSEPAMEAPGQHGDHDRPGRRGPPLRLGEADGAVPEGVTVFDDEIPAVANLNPALLAALRQAAADAADDGVELYVTSGWRSRRYQEQLLRAAISEYGSEEEAARWVATADTSAHVSGDAVDLGPDDAMEWLSEHGAGYGLCQIYGNEPWHYELRPEAPRDGCPPIYADPTHDPRMRQ